jgi:hypothetical protein
LNSFQNLILSIVLSKLSQRVDFGQFSPHGNGEELKTGVEACLQLNYQSRYLLGSMEPWSGKSKEIVISR